MKQLEELARQKDTIDQDKQRIANELEQKDAMLRQEAQEKMSLEQMIREMEHKLVSGGQALEDKQKEQARAFREYQQKIKAERKKQKKLQEEQRKKDEELLSFSTQYKNLEEEAREKGKIINVLKEKYASV